MNGSLRAQAERWQHDAHAAVMVEVIDCAGSVPRGIGTRMLIDAHSELGTIGGGRLEHEAIAIARSMLVDGPRAPMHRHFALGPALGQCCGGSVDLSFAWLDDAVLAAWPERVPLFHLQIYGAGHVGRAIATLLATLDVDVEWIDQREDAFPAATALGSAWPQHIRFVCDDAVEHEVRKAPPQAKYLVLTHNHDLDQRITEAILRRGDFRYLGLIGSKTKRAKFARRFEMHGIAAATIARMNCPIGIEGITGKAPEQIAVAVVAQLLREG